MIRDPDIAALRTELEQLGNVVAPHSDHLCVRLPLFASVRIRVDEQGRLDCEPMFGPMSRTRALLFSTTLLTASTGALLYFTGTSALTFGAAFLTVMAGLGSACRFVLTENCITRIQFLWAARLRDRREAAAALPYTSVPALRAAEVPAPSPPSPSPDVNPPHRIRAERTR